MTYGGIVIAQAERSLRSFAPWGEIPHLLLSLLPVPRGAERPHNNAICHCLLPVPRGAERAQRRIPQTRH